MLQPLQVGEADLELMTTIVAARFAIGDGDGGYRAPVGLIGAAAVNAAIAVDAPCRRLMIRRKGWSECDVAISHRFAGSAGLLGETSAASNSI